MGSTVRDIDAPGIKLLQRWSFTRHEYEPYAVPKEWDTVVIADLDEEVSCAGCDIPVTKLRHILGKVDMTAYLESRSPRKQPPKWWQEEMTEDETEQTEDLYSPGF